MENGRLAVERFRNGEAGEFDAILMDVQMPVMNGHDAARAIRALEGQDEDSGDRRSFTRQSFWKKFVILSAGSFMNLLAGMIIIAMLFAGASGFYVDQISGFSEGFPLEGESGLMVGDVFYKVDGWRTYLRGDAAMLLSFNDGQGVDIEVIRNGKKIVLEDLPLYRGTYDGQ